MDLTLTFEQLGVALGLGLLVGLQWERTDSRLAGIRTFPLITILGTICAILSQHFGGWIVAAGFIALAGMILVGKMVELKEGPPDPGLTTEIAMLLMFGVGAYLVIGSKEVAIVIGGGTAVLLQFKGQLHGIAGRLGENDLKAIMQFVLISFVILPILPDRTFGPYAVLNPRQIWWMVVLIVGINLGGYIAYKFMGERAGIVLAGILGGVVSSTATTVSYARRTAGMPATSRAAAIVIMIASTVVFARLLLIIAMVAGASLPVAAPPILLILVILSVLSGWLWFTGRRDQHEMPAQQNPSELRSALVFGLLYALIVFAVAAAKERFGSSGLEIFVWSDMLDPNHNADPKRRHYYLAEGGYAGSWNHVPKELGIVCWYYEKREASLRHFSALGFRTMAGAYYDADNLNNPKGWLEALDATPGACGIMYTTWLNKYDLLGPFGDLVSRAN